jgi:hypothetical protein
LRLKAWMVDSGFVVNLENKNKDPIFK